MPYVSERTYNVDGTEVTVRELTGWSEYHVWLAGDKYEVWLSQDGVQEGRGPGWYTEVGGVMEGPWDTAAQLLDQLEVARGPPGDAGGITASDSWLVRTTS